jgi:hypothetical protein
MKILLQILFFSFTWFINLVNATPVFTKAVLPSYEVAFSKKENVKGESVVKIGVQNFARSGIEYEKQFSSISNKEVWARITHSIEQDEIVKGAGNLFLARVTRFGDSGASIIKYDCRTFSFLGLS